MQNPTRRIAFVLAATNSGSMIVNRLDFHTTSPGQTIGVGFQILENGCYDESEVNQLIEMLAWRRSHWGDGVVAVDCGANIGVHTVAAARAMTGWGTVLAIEPQERLYYALAGNIALNNCFNARAFHMAVGSDVGTVSVPDLDYLSPGSFGSLELRHTEATEFIGQNVDYSPGSGSNVPCMTIDSLCLGRLDFLKVDVEGMEIEVLNGAMATLTEYRPILMIEHIKVGWDNLANRLLPLGYNLFQTPMNLIAIHNSESSGPAVA